MVDELVVAVDRRIGVDVSLETGVVVLTLLCARNQGYALEVDFAFVPALLHGAEFVHAGFLLAAFTAFGRCLRVFAVGFELHKVGRRGLYENEIDVASYLDALGIGHIAAAVTYDFALYLLRHSEIVDVDEIFYNLFAITEYVFVVKVSCVDIHKNGALIGFVFCDVMLWRPCSRILNEVQVSGRDGERPCLKVEKVLKKGTTEVIPYKSEEEETRTPTPRGTTTSK